MAGKVKEAAKKIVKAEKTPGGAKAEKKPAPKASKAVKAASSVKVKEAAAKKTAPSKVKEVPPKADSAKVKEVPPKVAAGKAKERIATKGTAQELHILSLSKGQNYVLEDKGDFGLKDIIITLSGESRTGTPVDLNIVCAVFNKNKEMIDRVSWVNGTSLYSKDIGRHDERISKDKAVSWAAKNKNSEQIEVNFPNVCADAHYLVFAAKIRTEKCTFDMLKNATCILVDKKANKSLVKYILSSTGKFADVHAAVMVKLYRDEGVWKLQAVGEPTKGKYVCDVTENMSQLLGFQYWKPVKQPEQPREQPGQQPRKEPSSGLLRNFFCSLGGGKKK